MPDLTPRAIVSSKCMSYSEALLLHRRAAITDEGALKEGRDLFGWFEGVGALTDEKAPIAARSVELAITLLKTSTETSERTTETIKSTYLAYAGA
jgi:hypothetical protein